MTQQSFTNKIKRLHELSDSINELSINLIEPSQIITENLRIALMRLEDVESDLFRISQSELKCALLLTEFDIELKVLNIGREIRRYILGRRDVERMYRSILAYCPPIILDGFDCDVSAYDIKIVDYDITMKFNIKINHINMCNESILRLYDIAKKVDNGNANEVLCTKLEYRLDILNEYYINTIHICEVGSE